MWHERKYTNMSTMFPAGQCWKHYEATVQADYMLAPVLNKLAAAAAAAVYVRCGCAAWLRELTCLETCLIMSSRSASASSCSLGVNSERAARRGLAGDLGGEGALPPLEGGGTGEEALSNTSKLVILLMQ